MALAAVALWAAGDRTVAAGVAAVLAWIWWADRTPQVGDRGTRLFSEADRAVVYVAARGRCRQCRARIHWQRTCPRRGCDRCYHADHRIPHVLGGPTHLGNAQALCRACNLAKGARP